MCFFVAILLSWTVIKINRGKKKKRFQKVFRTNDERKKSQIVTDLLTYFQSINLETKSKAQRRSRRQVFFLPLWLATGEQYSVLFTSRTQQGQHFNLKSSGGGKQMRVKCIVFFWQHFGFELFWLWRMKWQFKEINKLDYSLSWII